MGSILSETFSVFFSNIVSFTIISVVAMAPLLALLFSGLFLGQSFITTRRAAVLFILGVVLLSLLAFPVATAAVTYGVFQQLRGRHAGVGASLRVGLSCLLPVLAVAILQGVAVFGGALLCVIPGVVLGVILAVAVPAAVEERQGVVAALNRSAFLTSGYRWTVFVVLFVVNFFNMALSYVVTASVPGQVGQLVSSGKDVLATAFGATAGAVLYYRLRSAKESVDIGELVSIFE